jgi:hypothetical protein
MMAGSNFGRIVKVRVYATSLSDVGLGASKIDYSNSYTEFSSVQKDGSQGFRIKGNIVQVMPTVAFNTNQIHLTLYNLGKNSRSILQSQIGTKIEIFAGYNNVAVRIGAGNILWCVTHKSGPDYITEIIAGDAQSALVNGTINKSFKGAVTYQQIINACIAAMAEDGITAGNIQDVPSGGFNQGHVLSRSPMVELFEVCQSIGLSATIVDGKVNVLKVGNGTPAPPITISVDTGLIGIPEVQPPGVIGFQDAASPVTASPQNNVSFTHLLRCDLTLWQQVNIVSKFINGIYVIQSVTQDFDSWEGNFFSKCEASRPPAAA